MTNLSGQSEVVNRLTSSLADRPIGDLMRQAHQRLVAFLDGALREAGYNDVTSPHVSVLATVDAEGSRLATLVERGRRTKQATAGLTSHLLARGYVTLQPDATDGRAKLYFVTQSGTALLRAAEKVVTEYEKWLDHMLGPDALSQLRGILSTIIDDRQNGQYEHVPYRKSGSR
jgi:DNA-binding MarR family transcriptional regulator